MYINSKLELGEGIKNILINKTGAYWITPLQIWF